MSDHVLLSTVAAIKLEGPGIIQIPPESKITVMESASEASETNLPAGMAVVIWQEKKYGVFEVDLQTKAMH